MALTDPGGGPAMAIPPLRPSSQQPIDDRTAYSLFAPQAGGVATQRAPQGGTINVAMGRDPNGYYWVDDGSPGGYWYRPEDQAVWRSTPATRAQDTQVTAAGGPVTYAPIVRGNVPQQSLAEQVRAKMGGGIGQGPTPAATGTTSTFSLPGAVTFDSKDGRFETPPPLAHRTLSPTWALAAGEGETMLPGVTRNSGDDPNFPWPNTQHVMDEEGRWIPLTQPDTLGGFRSLIPERFTAPLPDPWYFPLESTVEGLTSPLGIGLTAASAGFGGIGGGLIGAARGAAAGIIGEHTANTSFRGAEQLPEEYQAGGAVPIAAGLVGGGLAEGALLSRIGRSVDDAIPSPGVVSPPATVAPPRMPTVQQQIDDILSPEGTRLPDEFYWQDNVLQQRPPAIPRAATPPVRSSIPEPETGITPAAPRPTRTLPTPAAVASTKKPVGAIEVVTTVKRKGAILEAQVKIDGADAGIIRRAASGEPYEALYRNDQGALTPVPKNAAGEPFTGTKVQAQNAVANAYTARGRMLEDVPRGARTPRAAATVGDSSTQVSPVATGRRPLPINAGRHKVQFEDQFDRDLYIIGQTRSLATGANPGWRESFERVADAMGLPPGAFDRPMTPEMSAAAQAIRAAVANADAVDGVKHIPASRAAPPVRAAGGAESLGSPASVEVAPSVPGESMESLLARSLQQAENNRALAAADEPLDETGMAMAGTLLNTLTKTDIRYRPPRTPQPWKGPLAFDTEAGRIVGVNVDVSAKAAPVARNIYTYDPRTGARIATGRARGKLRPLSPDEEGQARAILALDTPEAKAIADAIVAPSPKDMAVPGSEAHARRIAVETGEATPAQEVIFEAEVRAARTEIAAASANPLPEPSVALRGLVGDITETTATAKRPRFVTRAGRRTGRLAGQATFYPFRALRDFKLAGDLLLGRQMWPALLAETGTASRVTAKVLVRNFLPFKNRAFREAAWRESEAFAEANPWASSILREGQRQSLSEELFLTNLAAKIPGLKQMEIANALILNGFRMGFMQRQLWLAAQAGQDITDATFLRSLDEMAGALSGRGFGEFLDNNARWLNGTLFISARYTASKPQFWGMLLPSSFGGSATGRRMGLGIENPWVAAQARRRVVRAAVTAAAGFAALSFVPGVETVHDPFSSKFGQFKWKGNWYDFLGGLQDPVRLSAQIGANRWVSERGFKGSFSEKPWALNSLDALKSRDAWGTTGHRMWESIIGGVGDYVSARVPPLAREILQTRGVLEPFPEQPVPGVPSWALRYLPISVGQYYNYWKEVETAPEAFYSTVNTLFTAGGFNVRAQNKVTTWEENLISEHAALLDFPQYKLRDGDPVSVDNISRTGFEYIESNPDIFGERPDTSFGEFKEQKERVEKVRAQFQEQQLQDDAQADSLRPTLSREKWRIQHSTRRRDLSSALEAEYGDSFQNDPDSPDVVKRYFAYIDANKFNEAVDWDAVETWVSALSPEERSELDTYIGLRHDQGTSFEKLYYIDQDTISRSGYWEQRDEAFAEWRHSDEYASQFATYDDWRAAFIEREMTRILAETPGLSPNVALNDAYKVFNGENNATGGFNEAFKATELYEWVESDPFAAKKVEEWEYRQWDEAARDIIYEHDPTAAQSKRQEYEVRETLLDTVIRTPAGQQPYAEAPTAAWRDYAGRERLRAPDGRRGTEFDSYEAFKEAGGEDDEKAGWKAAISAEDYKKNPKAYIRVRTGTNKGGTPHYEYLNPSAKAEVEAIAGLYKANPDAVKEAFRLGLPGFRTGSGGNLSKAELAWLESEGVRVE